MWIGILTPGAHPSRPVATVGDVTLYAWTARARMRIDGPAAAVDAGVRALREQAAAAGDRTTPPRCFVCREPCAVPDGAAARADAIDADPGADTDLPPLEIRRAAALEAAAQVRGGEATLVFVEVADVTPAGDPGAEEALVVLPAHHAALLVPLAALPSVLPVAEALAGDADPLTCARCGVVLPAGRSERDAADRVPRRRAGTGRSAAPRRGGRRAA